MKLISSIAGQFSPSINHVSYPFAKILVNGLDVTSKFLPLLIDMQIEDNAGFESDNVSFTLANPKGNIFIPKKGAQIAVLCGYKESALMNIGLYTLGQITLTGGAGQPHRMKLNAQAFDFNKAKISETKNRSFDEKTLYDIISQIAGENGLIPAIDQKFSSVQIKHIDQTNESDMHFLTRLSIDYDAIFKIAQKRLIFARRGRGLSVAGQILQSLQINLTPKVSYSLRTEDKESFDKAVVYYHDKNEGGRIKVEKGQGDRAFEYKRTLPTKEEAEAKAESLLNQKARQLFKLELTMPGAPNLTAETPIIIVEPSIPLLSGKWIIEKASHNLSPSGFTTSVSCYPDTDEAHGKIKQA